MRRSLLAALSATALVAAPAAAQVANMPVFNAGVNSGITLNVDYAKPNADAGKGHTLGFTGGIGLGPIGFTATYASTKPEGATDATSMVGATANLKLFGGPLVPISINGQLGVGYWKDKDFFGPGLDRKDVSVPVGISIAANLPTPGLSIKPWVAPRMQYMRTSGNVDDHQTKFGLSAGVNLGLVGGIQARVAYDYLKLDNTKPGSISFGLGYNFNVPVVPGI